MAQAGWIVLLIVLMTVIGQGGWNDERFVSFFKASFLMSLLYWGIYVGRQWLIAWQESATAKLRAGQRELLELYNKGLGTPFPTADAFLTRFKEFFTKELSSHNVEPPQSLLITMLAVAVDIYEHEILDEPPPPPDIVRAKDYANLPSFSYLRDRYIKRARLVNDPDGVLQTLLSDLWVCFYCYLRLVPQPKGRQPFAVPVPDVLGVVAFDHLTRTLQKIFTDGYKEHGALYQFLLSDYFRTVQPPEQIMRPSPLVRLLTAKVPFGLLPDEERFQHCWIIAPTGTGKTNLLENLIYCDLDRVARNEASIFIMDSQNELIPKLTAMKEFHEGPLKDKLIVLEPSSEFPLALNIFDNQLDDTDRFSQEDRENLYASSLEMADFVMSGLLGADLTAKQKGIFRYITQALQVIPNATIETFADLLRDDGYTKYRRYIRQLSPRVVDFFETRFQTSTFKATKEEIYWRLDTIMSNTTFADMFSHPKNKFNLYDELQSAKVICVNTKLGLLKKEGTEIFGRYFLAMLLQATERRMLIDKSRRLPTFCYIDECQDYVATEPKMASLLDKARKQKVSFTLAHQRLANIKDSDVLDALGNVRMKVAGRNQTDASALSKLFRVEPDFLSQAPQYSFAVNTGGTTLMAACPPSPIVASATDVELRRFRQKMRKQYTAPPYTPAPAPPEHARPTIDGEVVDPIPNDNIRPTPKGRPPRELPRPSKDDVNIKPSKDW